MSNAKQILGSSITGVVLGLLLAAQCVKKNEPIVVEKEKVVEVQVPVEVIKEKEVVKVVEKVVYKTQVQYLMVDSPATVLYIQQPAKKNRLYFLAGRGPDGLDVNYAMPYVNVSQSNGLVTGVGYERKLRDLVLGVQFLSNGTVLGLIGADF